MFDFRKHIHKINNVIDEVVTPCTYGMDVAFLIDITESMEPIIDEVKSSIIDIIDAIEVQVDVSDYRLGIILTDETPIGAVPNYVGNSNYDFLPSVQKDVVNGSVSDKYTTALQMLTLNNEVGFTTQLNKLNTVDFPMGSGAGSSEPMEIALQLVLDGFINPLRGGSVAKYVLVFTDNPPGGDGATDIATIMANLTSDYITEGIKVFVFGSTDILWQNIATNTGGAYSADYDGATVISLIEAGCSE